jgi:hypothetical protein
MVYTIYSITIGSLVGGILFMGIWGCAKIFPTKIPDPSGTGKEMVFTFGIVCWILFIVGFAGMVLGFG